MISKESFCSMLRAIQTQDEQDSKNGDVLTQLADPELQYHKVVFTTPLVAELLSILKAEFELADDKWVGDEISYFVYELNYGQNENAKDCIIREDGSKVSLTTPEELYDWIMEVRGERYINPQKKIVSSGMIITIDDRVKEEAVEWDKVIQPIIQNQRGRFL